MISIIKYQILTLSTRRDCVTSSLYQVPVEIAPVLVCFSEPLTLLATNTLLSVSSQAPITPGLAPISRMLYHLSPMVLALNSKETLNSFPNENVSSKFVSVGVISRNIYRLLFVSTRIGMDLPVVVTS